MRLPRPKLTHAPEVYAAIIHQHGNDPVRLAHSLQHSGWTLRDAAWASVHWPPEWLAAAIAHAREAKGGKLHTLSTDALAKLKADLARGESSAPPAPRKTTRIIRTKKEK